MLLDYYDYLNTLPTTPPIVTPASSIIRVNQNSSVYTYPDTNAIDGNRLTLTDLWATQDSGLSDYLQIGFSRAYTVVGVRWLNVTLTAAALGHVTLSTVATNTATGSYGNSPPRALTGQEYQYPNGQSLAGNDTTLYYPTPVLAKYIYVTINSTTSQMGTIGEFQWIFLPEVTLVVDSQTMCSATLRWASSDTSSLFIDNGVGYVTPLAGGTITVTPPATSTTYTITATGAGGVVTASCTVTLTSPTVTPDVTTGAISYFGGGAYYGAGLWRISYISGSYKTSPTGGWTVNYGEETGFRRTAFQITDGKGNVYDTPGHFETFDTQAACLAANTGLFQPFYHQGGPLGVYLLDTNYTNNTAGTPSPTFRLCGPGPSGIMTADTYTILPGATATLTWAVANADTVVIDKNVGAVAAMGTAGVTPSRTTTYTLTATRFGLIFTTEATIVVTRPTPPQNLKATGAGGGVVNLTWDASQNCTGYIVKRSTSPNGTYTTVGTPATSSFADTTPVPGSTYYYYVTATDGTYDSGYLFVVSGFSLLTPAAPASLTAQPQPALVRLQWPAVFTAASYAVTRALSADMTGGVVIASGMTGTTYSDSDVSLGVTYYYTVTATNAAATGPASPVASAQVSSIGGFSNAPAVNSAFVDGSRPNSTFS